MNGEALQNLLQLLQLSEKGGHVSQVMVPLGGDSGAVAMLCGDLEVGKTLRKDGKPVEVQTAIQDIKTALQFKSTVIDLSKQIEELGISEPQAGDAREVEIKESWSHADEHVVRNRQNRLAYNAKEERARVDNEKSLQSLPEDIEALLAAAEQEEKEQGNGSRGASKVKEIRASLRAEQPLAKAFPSKPRNHSSLVGDVIEHVHAPSLDSGLIEDETSKKIILNELRTADLKRSSLFKASRRENK